MFFTFYTLTNLDLGGDIYSLDINLFEIRTQCFYFSSHLVWNEDKIFFYQFLKIGSMEQYLA